MPRHARKALVAVDNAFRLYTAEDVAEMTGMSRDWLWRQCRGVTSRIAVWGWQLRFSRDDLRELRAKTGVSLEDGADGLWIRPTRKAPDQCFRWSGASLVWCPEGDLNPHAR